MTNTPFSSQSKKPKQNYFNDSILESLRDLGSGVGKTVAKDVVGKTAGDALQAIFGGPVKPAESSHKEYPFAPKPEMQPKPAVAPRPEILRPESVAREQAAIKQEIESVRMELKALAGSLKSLNTEVQRAIDQVPVNPGVYHKNFFARLRSVLQLLRQQVEDSSTWNSMYSGRKKKKGYWGMYKKHGTQFGLSNERTAATQAG